MTKAHFSATQLSLIATCPEAFRRRYIERERMPSGLAAARGKGLHGGAAHNFRQKIQSGIDLRVNDIIDSGIAAFDEEIKDGVLLAPDEAGRGADLVAGETRDDLRAMLDCHAKSQAPAYQPLFVEHKVLIELPNAPRDLMGVLDVATADAVIDFKTAKRSKPKDEADTSVQLTIYAACFRQETGKSPSFVALDSVIQTAKETKRQLLVSKRDEADFRALAHRINAVQQQIDAGSFPPAPAGSWQCSARYCYFHSTCRFVNPGRHSQGD